MTETRESWPFADRHVIRFGVIFLVAMSLSTPGRIAAHEGDKFDQYPLRPADTSNPRDTLNSFLTNLDQAIKAWQTGQPINVRIRIFDRAAGTFDTSGMSESDLRATKIKAALLLKEILDRIALPPDDQIPGDDDVGSGDQPLTELGRMGLSLIDLFCDSFTLVPERVAVARKLAVIMHRMWMDGSRFQWGKGATAASHQSPPLPSVLTGSPAA